MSWSSIPDKATGDVFTEAMWDTHIKDNGNSGYMRALGDSAPSATVTAITFTNISTLFAHLDINYSVKSDRATPGDDLNIQFNGDTATNYAFTYTQTAAAAVTAAEVIGSTRIMVNPSIPTQAIDARLNGVGVIHIPHYQQTLFYKNIIAEGSNEQGTATGTLYNSRAGGWWHSTAAITQVSLFPQNGAYSSGTRVTLYGRPT